MLEALPSMDSDPVERRLAAILNADVAGYSRLMADDENATIRIVTAYREQIELQIRQVRGRLVDFTGDNFLAEFSSPTEAVRCAIEIQQVLRALNANLSTERKMQFRMGIHLGEVRAQGERLFGTGINVAARLQGLAKPGELCISSKVFEEVRGNLDFRFEDLGEHEVKNIPEPVHVYAVEVPSEQVATDRSVTRYRRRLAVLATLLVLVVAAAVTWQSSVELRAWTAIYLPRITGGSVEQELGFVTTQDGVRIAYATSGSGPPFLYVLGWGTHLQLGLGSSLYGKGAVIAAYSAERTVVRYDGRGFGLSERTVDDFSLDALVADIEAVVDTLGFDRVAVYAMSTGAPAAIEYASRHPNRVSALVLIAASAGVTSSGGLEPASAEFNGTMELFRTSWDSDRVRAVMVQALEPNADEAERLVVDRLLQVCCTGPSIAGFFTAQKSMNLTESARRLRVPTLMVHSSDDRTIPIVDASALASVIPAVKFEILKGLGHRDTERSPRVIRIVLDFLAKTEGDAPTD